VISETVRSSETRYNKNLCNGVVLPILLYGSEDWTVKTKDKTRIRVSEMEFAKERNRLHMDGLCENKGILKE
jgi:hypothetical protein